LSLSELLDLIRRAPVTPPDVDPGESCPVNIMATVNDITLSVTKEPDNTYTIMVFSSSYDLLDTIHDEASFSDVTEILERFYDNPKSVLSMIKKIHNFYIKQGKGVRGGSVLRIDEKSIYGIPYSSVREVIISLGGFLKSAKVSIEYFDQREGYRRVDVELENKDDAKKIYNILQQYIPGKVLLK